MKRAIDTQPLRLWVAPELIQAHGPELAWTWSELLVGVGWPWELVSEETGPCDIAYAPAGRPSPPSRLRIHADANAWNGTPRPADEAVEWIGAHAEQSAWSASMGRDDGTIICERDFLADSFAILSGRAEGDWTANKHGHRALPERDPYRELCSRAPVSKLFRSLESTIEAFGLGPAPFPRWPGGAEWAAAASHDVDYPVVLRWLEPLRILGRLGARGARPAWHVARGLRHHWHFDSWMRTERRLGIRSSFYFVARKGSLAHYALGTPDPFYDVTAPHFVELFRRIEAEGFEVGLQASYRANEDPRRFAAEKRTLEGALGHEIQGNRHHYWRMDPEDPQRTLAIHDDIGLEYDCSLALEHHLGWRRGCTWPFRPYVAERGKGVRTVQLSTAWMDDQVFAHAAVNGIKSDDDRAARLDELIATAAADGGLLVTDIHEYVYDDALFPHWLATYERFWERVMSHSDVWVATPADIASHWSERAGRIEAMSTGLTGSAPQR